MERVTGPADGRSRRSRGANIAPRAIPRPFACSLCAPGPEPWRESRGRVGVERSRDGADSADTCQGWASGHEPCLAREVVEDLADSRRLEDEGEDPHLAAALLTDQRIDLVDPADQVCPHPPCSTAVGGIRLFVVRRNRGVRRQLVGTTACPCYIRVAAEIPQLVQPGLGYVLEQPGQELGRLEALDTRLATHVPLRLRVIENFARAGVELQALDGDGGTQEVPAEPFDAGGVAWRYAHRVVNAEP